MKKFSPRPLTCTKIEVGWCCLHKLMFFYLYYRLQKTQLCLKKLLSWHLLSPSVQMTVGSPHNFNYLNINSTVQIKVVGVAADNKNLQLSANILLTVTATHYITCVSNVVAKNSILHWFAKKKKFKHAAGGHHKGGHRSFSRKVAKMSPDEVKQSRNKCSLLDSWWFYSSRG